VRGGEIRSAALPCAQSHREMVVKHPHSGALGRCAPIEGINLGRAHSAKKPKNTGMKRAPFRLKTTG